MLFYRLGNFFEKLGELPKKAKAYFAHRRLIMERYENLQPYDQALKDEYDRIMKAEADHHLDSVPKAIIWSAVGIVVILLVWLIDALVFHTKVTGWLVFVTLVILIAIIISALIRLMKVVDEADVAAIETQREAREQHYADYLRRKQRVDIDGKPIVKASTPQPNTPSRPPQSQTTKVPRYPRRQL